MGGTKGGEAVSSAAGTSLCDAPLWCAATVYFDVYHALAYSTDVHSYGPVFSHFLVTFGTFGRQRRRRRRSARAARKEREGGAGKGEGGPRLRLQGRKAHRLDLIV